MASSLPELSSSELSSSQPSSSQPSSCVLPLPELSSPKAMLSSGQQSGRPGESSRELNRLSLEEILDQDLRPTFVLDLKRNYVINHNIQPILINSALRKHKVLFNNVTGTANDNISIEGQMETATYAKFKDWATAIERQDGTENTPPEFYCYGVLWSSSTVRQKWRIISGNAILQTDVTVGDSHSAPSTEYKTDKSPAKESSLAATISEKTTINEQAKVVSTSLNNDMGTETARSSLHILSSTPEDAVPDWTVPHPRGTLSEYTIFARAVDWTNTPLGPMESWSTQFRELANLTMVSTSYVRGMNEPCH
jgi:hypothetical protein